MIGIDSVIDYWLFYGLGDMLEKVNLYVQFYICFNEQNFFCLLFLVIGDVLLLNEKGECVWLKVQDDVSFVLVDVFCFVEVVVCILLRIVMFYKG